MHRNTSTRTAIATAGLGLIVAVLAAGCGAGDGATADSPTATAGSTSAYCDALKAGQADIESFTAGTPDLARFSELVALIDDLAAKAPDQVSAPWKSMADPLSALDDALKTAGIDLTTYVRAAGSGTAAPGVTSDKMVALGQQVAALQDPKIKEYAGAISADAKTTCGITLKTVGS